MGYLLNGVYHKGEPPIDKLKSRQNSTFKQSEHNRQRKDFSREIQQPRDANGKFRQEYLEAYPEAAQEYRIIPSDEELKKQ